ncbi:hypothetical protein EFV37_22105 [Mesorhizobium loti]|uniref:Uncharacterized protein n=1 Tax=Mesorhizobium jarvisii TaxID=1777867 RepID=A0A6M7TKQ6_9HYPH|nr:MULTISPECIES: hypothetical protein [Mesorhizobium]OBQ59583.1 hypothetical protein A9K72_25565 [Mesorhizobium loti]QKC64678.1 hypothetical protein EB229_22100 [Mesorhizobium jarvisii]QKD10592.1 hypothetical protein EFV37_22105 [Mesorhizobium loti]RJT30582.1 hypothetical protein D3242_24735 [Mesorhizobium jarvisii]
MADDANQGHRDAHTPRPGGDNAPPAELPGADPLDLLAGLPDGEGEDVLALAAEIVAAPARARGRPMGAANRKNGDLIRYLQARGHRDPMVTLSMIQSADFGALCKMVGAAGAKQKIAVLGIIRGAAADLMPYHHAKKPQQIELPTGDLRPLMVIGEMNVTQINGDGGFMSAGVMPDEKPNEINGAAVRLSEGQSHENANAFKDNDNPGSSD